MKTFDFVKQEFQNKQIRKTNTFSSDLIFTQYIIDILMKTKTPGHRQKLLNVLEKTIKYMKQKYLKK